MKPLGNTYTKNGFHYQVLARTGNVVLASQHTVPNAKGTPMAWEVLIVRPTPERFINGKTIPAYEATPGNEEWGTRGWTFHNVDAALIKFHSIIQREEAKPISST